MKLASLHRAPENQKFATMFVEVATAIFIILWIYTGISKWIEFRSFWLQQSVSPIELIRKFDKAIAIGVPTVELVMAILLVIKGTRLVGFAFSFIAMIAFSTYVGYLMIKLPNLPCSCGGIISQLNWTQHLALNILLVLISLTSLVILRKKRRTLR